MAVGKKLYFHVGMDKTGTSAIQAYIHKNRSLLESEFGLLYPQTGLWTDKSHHALAFDFLNAANPEQAPRSSMIADLRSEIGSSNQVLISSELFFKVPFRPFGRAFVEAIFEPFSDVKVIVYVRRQDDWVQSRHKHSVLSGAELTLDALMRPHFCDYSLWIKHWEDIVGRENVIVRTYDRTEFVRGSILDDFASLLGVDGLDASAIGAVNISLGNAEYELKRFSLKVGLPEQEGHELNQFLIGSTKMNKDPRNRAELLGVPAKEKLIQTYREANAFIARQYRGSADGVLFSSTVTEEMSPWDFESETDFALVKSLVEFLLQSRPRLHEQLKALSDAYQPARPTSHDIALATLLRA